MLAGRPVAEQADARRWLFPVVHSLGGIGDPAKVSVHGRTRPSTSHVRTCRAPPLTPRRRPPQVTGMLLELEVAQLVALLLDPRASPPPRCKPRPSSPAAVPAAAAAAEIPGGRRRLRAPPTVRRRRTRSRRRSCARSGYSAATAGTATRATSPTAWPRPKRAGDQEVEGVARRSPPLPAAPGDGARAIDEARRAEAAAHQPGPSNAPRSSPPPPPSPPTRPPPGSPSAISSNRRPRRGRRRFPAAAAAAAAAAIDEIDATLTAVPAPRGGGRRGQGRRPRGGGRRGGGGGRRPHGWPRSPREGAEGTARRRRRLRRRRRNQPRAGAGAGA